MRAQSLDHGPGAAQSGQYLVGGPAGVRDSAVNNWRRLWERRGYGLLSQPPVSGGIVVRQESHIGWRREPRGA